MTTRKNFQRNVERRRLAATERAERANKRSPEQKLAVLMSRGHEGCSEAIALENWIQSQASGVED